MYNVYTVFIAYKQVVSTSSCIVSVIKRFKIPQFSTSLKTYATPTLYMHQSSQSNFSLFMDMTRHGWASDIYMRNLSRQV